LGWQAREDVTLTLLATMEHESGRDDSVVAGLGGQSFVATDAVSDGSISNLGVGASVRLTPTATLSVGAEFRESGETHEDLRVNASVSWRF
jgi:outer membrane autotransporter protein